MGHTSDPRRRCDFPGSPGSSAATLFATRERGDPRGIDRHRDATQLPFVSYADSVPALLDRLDAGPVLASQQQILLKPKNHIRAE